VATEGDNHEFHGRNIVRKLNVILCCQGAQYEHLLQLMIY